MCRVGLEFGDLGNEIVGGAVDEAVVSSSAVFGVIVAENEGAVEFGCDDSEPA